MNVPLPAIVADQNRERRREIVTPEGVPLVVMRAQVGDRIGAFAFDMLLITVLLYACDLLNGLLAQLGDMGLVQAILLLGVFLLVSFYFPFFELRWQGRTPGKRLARIRVIDRYGGRLTGEAIFVRNLTRWVEVVLPLAALQDPAQIWPGAESWVGLMCVGWLLVLLLLPLFNRDRLRLGDLVAGTLVIEHPRPRLLADLAARAADAEPVYSFTAEQLDHYGAFELQVLEGLLRQQKPAAEQVQLVAQKIRARIRWDPTSAPSDELRFLRDFYGAQRARLEQRLLLGERRERKRAR